VDRDKIT